MTFTVTSNDLTDSGVLPDTQVYSKGNQSPHLKWSGAPEGTRSYAITCFDPDAPTGSGFWHWTVANIPVDVTEMATGASANAMPTGSVEGRTDFSPSKYGGAAPPAGHGPHRYIFTVYAVDVEHLDLTPDSSGAFFGFNMHFHALAQASITCTYENTGQG